MKPGAEPTATEQGVTESVPTVSPVELDEIMREAPMLDVSRLGAVTIIGGPLDEPHEYLELAVKYFNDGFRPIYLAAAIKAIEQHYPEHVGEIETLRNKDVTKGGLMYLANTYGLRSIERDIAQWSAKQT